MLAKQIVQLHNRISELSEQLPDDSRTSVYASVWLAHMLCWYKSIHLGAMASCVLVSYMHRERASELTRLDEANQSATASLEAARAAAGANTLCDMLRCLFRFVSFVQRLAFCCW